MGNLSLETAHKSFHEVPTSIVIGYVGMLWVQRMGSNGQDSWVFLEGLGVLGLIPSGTRKAP